MRTLRLLTLTVSVVVTSCLLGVGYSPPAARASCVGPSLAVGTTADPGQPTSTPANLARGQTTRIAGIFFHAGCEDTFSSPGPGCRAPQPSDPQSPLTDVHFTLTQGDRRWDLGTADAADREQQYAIVWDVTIPNDVAVGTAALTAGSATVAVQIR
jgi:hypothetical protein